MLLKRILAQLIDILIYILVNGFVFVAVTKSSLGDIASVLVALVVIHILYIGVQYPFYKNGQSIGKGFFRLFIVSTNPEVIITPKHLLVREIMFKVLTCYISCLPAFWKNECLHDKSCYTKVICK